MSAFGDFLKDRRKQLDLPLRRFCELHGVDPSNWSKLERGRIPPPQHERLTEYARYLELEECSDAWYQLFDLAAAEAGRIPQDLQGPELAAKLPVLFRTLRENAHDGGPDNAELLDELKRKIAGA